MIYAPDLASPGHPDGGTRPHGNGDGGSRPAAAAEGLPRERTRARARRRARSVGRPPLGHDARDRGARAAATRRMAFAAISLQRARTATERPDGRLARVRRTARA